MPHNKKSGRRVNSKKKKGASSAARHTPVYPIDRSNTSSNNQSSIRLLQDISNFPTFQNRQEKSQNDKTDSILSGGGYYEIYKRATTRFWCWMKEVLPDSRMKFVNDLKIGADLILERTIAPLSDNVTIDYNDLIVIPTDVMKELSLSIQYRELLTQTKFGDGTGDKGHQYIIEVLRYCRDIFKFGRKVARMIVTDHAQQQQNEGDKDEKEDVDAIGGRFHVLLSLDDDDDSEDDQKEVEEEIRQGKLPTFQALSAPSQEIDIEEVLINGDDRFQATALLRTMDDLMGVVVGHYGLLKNSLRDRQKSPMKEETFNTSRGNTKLLMECAVVVNMATESIQAAENALASNHPHLASPYHVLALVFLPYLIADVEKLVDKQKLEHDSHMALQFVAEIVECSFHNRGDDQIPQKIKQFMRKAGIQRYNLLGKATHSIHMMTSFETQFLKEESLNAQRNHVMQQAGIQPHSWLQQSEYIGGDCCILNTLNITQKLMDLVQDETKLVGRPGFWGPIIHEQNSPAISMRGGLDEAFAGYIMPELFEICKQAPFHHLPERSQLITVLDLLQRHLKSSNRCSPVSAALCFGLHAMLHSIFILQGEGDLAHIASATKQSYNCLFEQLDQISDEKERPQNAPQFYKNVRMFTNLVNFAKPLKGQIDPQLDFLDPSIAENLAFWNPLIGGEYLLYGTYICSIGLGSATVDSLGQLRFVSHLYNALKYRKSSIGIQFLETLDKVFASTKGIWVGGRPDKGSFCKHFWMAWGMSISDASKMAAEAADGHDSIAVSLMRFGKQKDMKLPRKLDEILPEQFSVSYRCLVQRDFTGEEDAAEYTVKGATKESKKRYGELNDLLTRVNTTRDSMDEDGEEVLSINFSALGCILLEFTNALSEYMGWDNDIDQMIAMNPEFMRSGKTVGGERMKGFNASDLNWRRQAMAHAWGLLLARCDSDISRNDDVVEKAKTFTFNFFQNIPKERYVFFVEQEGEPNRAQRNPLKGRYPHGRTGKTARDPLQGFFHFKYSKKGKPVVRLIKPGRYTPFHPTSDGSVSTPYEEQGSKMRKEPSGKFRHIASYSIDELIQLGWDGAMYNSSQGKHEASGHHVPFVVGYDSDSDDEYEPIDIKAGKRAGTIDLSSEEDGSYMLIPDFNNPGKQTLMRYKNRR